MALSDAGDWGAVRELWRTHHDDCTQKKLAVLWDGQKVERFRGDADSLLVKVAFSQTSDYVGVFCGTDADCSYTFKDDSNSTSRFYFADITKDVVVAMRRVCAHTLCQCATFGSLARCLHLNPQEMENDSLWFAVFKTHAEVRQFGDAVLH